MTTKRPRSAGAPLAIVAALVLLLTLSLASAASLRATSPPALEGHEGGEDTAAAQLPASRPTSSTKKQLTAKLAASSHPRASSGKVAHRGEEDAPEIPLVGIGAGNLPHGRVPYVLASALGVKKKKKKQRPGSEEEELGYRLIDTSHAASALEVLVGRSLGRLPPSTGNGNESDDAYHVVIKIWHTHLGYERTVRSVQDSLADILPGSSSPTKKGKTTRRKKQGDPTTAGGPDVRVHALLQYPRCYDSLFASEQYVASPNHPVKYADCHSEEEALDEATKRIGPSPLLDKDHAWKRSYRALEELYHRGTLESIGISNFGPADLNALFEVATVGPHVYQGTLHTLLTQEGLVEQLVGRGVHYQCHDAAGAVMNGREAAPRAYERLERIGAVHGTEDGGGEGGGYGYSAVQVALGWLVHHRGAGAVSGTSDAGHLAENSPGSLAAMPRFGPREALDIETALLALVTGEDLQGDVPEEEEIDADGTPRPRTGDDSDEAGVVATVFNSLPSKSIQLFRIHPETGEQVQLSHKIPPGRSGRVIANGDDVLVAYDGYGVAVRKFRVEGGSRGGVDFIVEA